MWLKYETVLTQEAPLDVDDSNQQEEDFPVKNEKKNTFFCHWNLEKIISSSWHDHDQHGGNDYNDCSEEFLLFSK